MQQNDYLIRGTACKDQFRFFAVNSTTIVQTALDLHKMAPSPTLLLGRLLTGALLMGAEIKEEAASLTLNIDAEGPLKGAIAVYEQKGKVRGYAKAPDYFDEVLKNNLLIGKLLGKGTLNVIKDIKLKAPMTGTIELTTGEVAEDIAQYYLRSEQIPTAVSLGVLFDSEGRIRSAGGYLIQQMPSANPDDVEKLKQNLANTPYITDLLDMGLAWDKILSDLIFKDMDWAINESIPVSYKCNCSKERFTDALRLLGIKDLESMLEGITPVCHYCSKEYEFTTEDMKQIIDSIHKQD
jgi:molecular chaperone Hsp33